MTDSVKLTRTSESLFDVEKCIICQIPSPTKICSSENGRKRIREAALVRNDIVSKRLKFVGDQDDFVYHMNNQCYKGYTMKAVVDRIKRRASDQERTEEPQREAKRASRTSILPRDKPTEQCEIYNQKCVVCGFIKHHGVYIKHRISETNRARKFLEATVFFQDDVYTRTCDLQDINSVFGADLYCHKVCVNKYLLLYDRESTKLDKTVDIVDPKKKAWASVIETVETGLSNGEGFELSCVRDSLNKNLVIGNSDTQFTNREVKVLLVNHFDNGICFSESKQVNKSLMFFKNEVTVTEMAEKIRSSDPIKEAAELIRMALLDVDFGLKDRFCDSTDLREAWNSVSIPKPLLRFFSYLFNFDMNEFRVGDDSQDAMDEDTDEVPSNTSSLSQIRRKQMHSLFQIMYYDIYHGKRRTPLHVMNSQAIYDACKRSTLITSFNHFGLCTSYDELLRHQNDMALYTIASSEETVPFPSHFNRTEFTTAAFDNFDHNEATLSGVGSCHDTVMVLFQDNGGDEVRKPRISETDVQHGPKTFNSNLRCQELQEFFKPTWKADIPKDYKVSDTHYVENELLSDVRQKDIAWLLGRLDLGNSEPDSINAKPQNQTMPIWSASNSVLSIDKVPLKRVAFLPVLPYPPTQYDTIYTAMKNLQGTLQYLDQSVLPITCDEGVYRIAREIQLIRPVEFNRIVLCLGSFHMAKIALGCLGKYLRGSGAENILIESGVFGVNVIDSVLSGKNYVRSLKGLQLLKEALLRLQWVSFLNDHNNMTRFKNELDIIIQMRQKISEKSSGESIRYLEEFKTKSSQMIEEFDEFVSENCTSDETFKYWNCFINLMSHVENLIRSDREGLWKLQLQSIQDLLPLFAGFDSTNYLRWCTLYLEDMRQLPVTAPQVHKAFMEGRFPVKRTPGSFKAVGADMALEQTINKSQKSASGIIGSTKKKQYVAKWEIIYHELLAITNLHREISGSTTTNYELGVNRSFTTSTTQGEERNLRAILSVIERNENPFGKPVTDSKLHNIQTNELVPEDIRCQILNIENIGMSAYKKFREERFCRKSVRFADTIHRTNMKTFASMHKPSEKRKPSARALRQEDAQLHRLHEIAKERGESIDELLMYDVCSSSPLFDAEGLKTVASKSDLVHELEKNLPEASPKNPPSDSSKTAYIVDIMANIRKLKTSNMKNFGEFCNNTLNLIDCTTKNASRIDLIFDSYIDRSIKDSERQKREKKSPIELHQIDNETPLPVEMDRFWPSSGNKMKLEVLIHNAAKTYSWSQSITEVLVSNFKGPVDKVIPACQLSGNSVYDIPILNNDIEEADLRIILHASHAAQQTYKRLVIMSSDTDVYVLLLYYWNELHSLGLEELWIKTGVGDSTRFVPLHILAKHLEQDLCQVLPAVHTLTGCDYTSKFGTKNAALKASPVEFLKGFASTSDMDGQFALAEEYLVNVLKRKASCKTTNELRCIIYHQAKRLSFKDLPPTSTATQLHIKRAFYATKQMTTVLLPESSDPLDPCSYGFEICDELLVPMVGKHPIPERCTMTCNCSKCATVRCPCRSKHVPCCSFCKCQSTSDSNSPSCKNPLNT